MIGIIGSDDKGRILLEEFGFDEFINYKKPGFAKTLSNVAPNGIDCYFDNVQKFQTYYKTILFIIFFFR